MPKTTTKAVSQRLAGTGIVEIRRQKHPPKFPNVQEKLNHGVANYGTGFCLQFTFLLTRYLLQVTVIVCPKLWLMLRAIKCAVDLFAEIWTEH